MPNPRLADIGDAKELMAFAESFTLSAGLRFDDLTFSETLYDAITAEDSYIYVLGRPATGACAVRMAPSGFDKTELIARCWSVWGDGGIQCLRAAVKHAHMRGCERFIADVFLEPRLKKVYERMGFYEAETCYMKSL